MPHTVVAVNIDIREERPSDHGSVRELNVKAFPTDAEARLVDLLREDTRPLISLVAVADGRVAGHILFSPVRVEKAPRSALVLGLGPMAVTPERQRQGIGGRLVREGLERCRGLQAAAVVVLGHLEYYPRFGFQPARPAGLYFRAPEMDPYFFVLELEPGALGALSGEVRYPPPFDRV